MADRRNTNEEQGKAAPEYPQGGKASVAKLHPREIIIVQERERQRIALDLHDQLGQMSISLGAGFTLMERAIQKRSYDEAMRILADNKEMLKEFTDKMKDIAFNLRPLALDFMGPVSALREYFSQQTKRHALKIEFEENLENVQLDEEVAIVIYRIIQEALVNVLRHARATVARIRLHANKGVMALSIRDDGAGFDVKKVLGTRDVRKMGLSGIKERVDLLGGTLTIESGEGKGTSLLIQLPLESAKDGG